MTNSEFIEATTKLEEYYDKEYTNAQRIILFEELKELSIQRFRQLISVIIRKSKYLPKLADFMEASQETPYHNTEDFEPVECDVCKSSGYVYYKKIYEGLKYDFVCRCVCPNGQHKNKDVPTFEELGIYPNEEIKVEMEVNE